MTREEAKKMAQSRDCQCVKGKDRDNNYVECIDKIFDWHESEVKKLTIHHVRRSKTTRFKDGLKPCPFCARQPKIYSFSEKTWTVTCKCGCENPRDSVSENGAKTIWNRRRWDYIRKVG